MSASPQANGAFYNASHRAFLQVFLAHQVLTFDQAKPLLAKIISIKDGGRGAENDVTVDDLNDYISVINHQIEPFGYEIRSTHSQSARTRSRNDRIYAFVNTTSDPQTQLATSHTPDEIAFVKRVLDHMFETKNKPSREVMAAASMDALRLHKAPRESLAATNGNGDINMLDDGDGIDGDAAPQPTQATQTAANASSSITMKQAEELLDSLVEEGWLELSPAKFYSLTPRALLELAGWLQETYNDPDAEDGEWQPIKKCQACREILTVGQRCADEECNCRLHDFCARGVFQGRSAPKCPLCQTEWTGRNFVGERASRNYRPGRNSDSDG